MSLCFRKVVCEKDARKMRSVQMVVSQIKRNESDEGRGVRRTRQEQEAPFLSLLSPFLINRKYVCFLLAVEVKIEVEVMAGLTTCFGLSFPCHFGKCNIRFVFSGIFFKSDNFEIL